MPVRQKRRNLLQSYYGSSQDGIEDVEESPAEMADLDPCDIGNVKVNAHIYCSQSESIDVKLRFQCLMIFLVVESVASGISHEILVIFCRW